MRFKVTVTHTRVETFEVEAKNAGDAATMWRGAQPITDEGPVVTEVLVQREHEQ